MLSTLYIALLIGIQGRFNRIMMLVCSFAKDTEEADEVLSTIRRILSALPYVMFAPTLLGGNQGFLHHAGQILKSEERDKH